MKKTILKRVLALAMALSVCSSLIVVPANAADKQIGTGEVVIITAAPDLAKWSEKNWQINSQKQAQNMFNNLLFLYSGLEMISPSNDMTIGTAAYKQNSVTYVPLNYLNDIAARVNKARGLFEMLFIGAIVVEDYYDTGNKGIAIYFRPHTYDKGSLYFDEVNQEWYESAIGTFPDGTPMGFQLFWLCDPDTGNILLSNDGIQADEPVDEEDSAVSSSSNIVGRWVADTEALKSKTYRMVGYEDLHNRALEIRGYLSLRNGKYYIIDYMGENIYCGNDGLPYCAWPKQATVTETIRETDVVIDSATQVEIAGGSNVELNIDELIATLPDGSTINADNIIYNDDSKTYYVNTSQGAQSTSPDGTTTYNTTYNYAYTYNIDYTNVTYIGQTAEYTEVYDVYYKLPDGRSSADLTAAELEQLNLQVDVLNYGRSADDVSLRSLYHFDGTIEDASYWNYCTGFQWNSGASLTYLDAGNFDGCLYLDEQEHDFAFTLPSNLSNSDFTLQFRYYQSSTLAPQTDSFLKIGDTLLMQSNGKQFLDCNGNVLCTIPIGTWNELALVRHSETLYYYLNGVKVGSLVFAHGVGNTIRFTFGAEQQTYKYFDELRVLSFALVESGSSYTPTSVPYDTNLSLILPTESRPIADEYWNVTTTKTNLFGFDFEGFLAGTNAVNDNAVTQLRYTPSFPKYFSVTGKGSISAGTHGMLFARLSGYTSVTGADSNTGVTCTAPVAIRIGTFENAKLGSGNVGTKSYTNYLTGAALSNHNGVSNASAPYVLSLALADGEVYSFPFNFSATGRYGHSVTYPWGSIILQTNFVSTTNTGSAGPWNTLIYIVPNTSIDVMYMELCSGTETDLSVEHVTSVTEMTPDQLSSFTLAVRSTVDVTSYQIGGVRPSLPKKGMVWALIENSKISSLQIYDGRAWVEVDGRIWTGSRWAPLTAYDVMLQKDLEDIVGTTTTPDYEYIYTDSGFWDWWQRSWNTFTEKFFNTQSQGGTSNESHVHTYVPETLTEATCTTAGQQKVTCTGCGDTKIEATKPLGHDFEEIADTESGHVKPTGLICSHCASTDISCELTGPVAVCTCNDCQYQWDVQADYEYGETLYKCRRCGEEKTDTKDDRGLFALIGGFFADTIRWIVSKLGSLVDAFSALAQLFSDFIDTVISFAGDNPALFAAAFALMPADLMTLIWFSIVSGIIMLVWRKFKG